MEEERGRAAWQVRELVGWIGAGRRLTQTGRVTLADARALVERLETGDAMDPVIGDRMFKTKSSEELYHLTLLVEWAKAARLLRVRGGRLVPVKKNAGMLEKPQELWTALFDAVPRIGDAVLPSGWLESVLSHEYETGLKALLHGLYTAAGPVTTEELYEAVWEAVTALYVLDDVPAERLQGWRGSNDRDVRQVLDALAALGAVQLTEEGAGFTARGRDAAARLRGGPTPGDLVLQLHIELVDVEVPKVWRRLQVPAAIRLNRLHLVIQAAMGWHNCHLHQFTAVGVQYGRPHPEFHFRDERAVTLGDLLGEGESCTYTYDFGDSWDHLITVEHRLEAQANRDYPVCVGGAGACPPEDCGGAPGFAGLKEVMADPSHVEHDSMLEWLGLDSAAGFDGARFTVEEADARLRALPMA